ncbi:DUF4214 domain-containing protein [Siccirubricoccus sp. KC 17139]|uniref:DUF4214 domain-containing protein n=1 Tax=Siccirubricoccus soli TaxID=2899147 RepID=A0ABT1D5X7_9PROT|nr:DUF4214 domain-containing protein [Siccirubricoccus soli]MCO6417301.1 DUF4214 domain-containing protein [Siccirubricoccus soli]MCP2683436.1 DUF4214 domain-containing protein [Siccirubricoccus soli]
MPRAITVNGVLPSAIAENSQVGDWVGNLSLTGDLAGLAGVEVIGSHGLYFSARWDPATKLLAVTPAGLLDFEAFHGGNPLVDLQFRLNFADDSVQDLPQHYQVAVLDRDDTPPIALAFATGGAVTAGAIGATIGTLAVTDPDSSGSFHFSFPEEDAWRFEVVDNALRLKSGVSLGLDEGPVRTIIIEVSDGLNSASFALPITVRMPEDQQSVIPLLLPGESLAGFTLDADGTTLRGAFEARQVGTDNAYGEGVRQLQNGQGEVWVAGVEQVKLADGQVDYAVDSPAAKAAALQVAVTGEAAEGAALGAATAAAEAGLAWVDLAASLGGAGLGVPGDAAFVAALFDAVFGRAPSGAELALQTGRLASGLDRAQLAVDLALSDEGLAHQAALHPDGLWSSTATGSGEWRTDAGGLAQAAGPPAAATDGVWVM